MPDLPTNTPAATAAEKGGWASRLKLSLARTGGQLADLFGRGGRIDDELYEELETILITADAGMDATRFLMAELRHQVKEQRLTEPAQVKEALAHCLLRLLKPLAQPLETGAHNPFIILLVRRKRRGQDHLHRQAGQAFPESGQVGAAGGG